MGVEFMSRRYPHIVKVGRRSDKAGWNGEGSIRTVAMPALGAEYDLDVDDPLMVMKPDYLKV